MTHKDIYTKFMIEYDKANITSSYPSLTPYEVATILDKAYLALIARKLTGNNTRRVPFEYDTKAVEDLRPLITTTNFSASTTSKTVRNERTYRISNDLLYYLEGVVHYGQEDELAIPINHEVARKFKATNSNMPWIKSPMTYLEGDDIHILIDDYKYGSGTNPQLSATYIKKFAKFAGQDDTEIHDYTGEPVDPDDPQPETPPEDDMRAVLDSFILDIDKIS